MAEISVLGTAVERENTGLHGEAAQIGFQTYHGSNEKVTVPGETPVRYDAAVQTTNEEGNQDDMHDAGDNHHEWSKSGVGRGRHLGKCHVRDNEVVCRIFVVRTDRILRKRDTALKVNRAFLSMVQNQAPV